MCEEQDIVITGLAKPLLWVRVVRLTAGIAFSVFLFVYDPANNIQCAL
jgi:hypothetical protein